MVNSTRLRLVVAVALALLLTSCGGDDGGGDGPVGAASGENGPDAAAPGDGGGGAVTGDSSQLEATAEEMFEAFVAGDDDAWFDTLSAACRDRLGFGAVQSHLDGRRFRIEAGGIDLSAMSVSASTVSSFDGTQGEVLLLLSGADAPFVEELAQTWVLESDGWHLDECDDIEPADGLDGFGADRSDPADVGFVIDADGLLVALRDVNLDNADIVAELGGAGPVNGGALATAQVTVDHVGAEPSIVLGERLTFSFVAGDTVYGEESDCAGSGDGFLDPALEIERGGSSPFAYLCREIDPADGPGLLLRIESSVSGDDWWFTLG
ncbi:MAG: hypothetical protein R2707_03445 [Acidimicrobiales bacterium]